MGTGVISRREGVKRPWREVNHLLRSSADFNGYTCAPVCLNGMDRSDLLLKVILKGLQKYESA